MGRFTSLYSGSSGNCSVVQDESGFLLLDMGKSCRTTLQGMQHLGLEVAKLQGILVTHEHRDHVQGLKVFLKHYPVPVFGQAQTLERLLELELVPPATELVALRENRNYAIGNFGVQSFATSHDVPCCGYRIHTQNGRSMAMATDLGTITPVVDSALQGADLVALEANYDKNCLQMGSYPYPLKRRIMSHQGHLDNEDCAAKVRQLVQEGCKRFALCHLSRENNTPDLARATVEEAILSSGIRPEGDLKIQTQKRDEPSPWMEF